MAEYIEREKAIECIKPHVKPTTVYGEGYMQAIEHALDILELMPASDVQPVVETEDLATATEQFICKNCGIRIENFEKVVLEEDNDGYIDKLFCEYRFKFCPECGAKVR